MNSTELKKAVLDRLRLVIDPETNVDVVRMQLVPKLRVDASGGVSYTFRPSSFVCPIAVTLAANIKRAVSEVPNVASQRIAIAGYAMADELEKLINEEN